MTGYYWPWHSLQCLLAGLFPASLPFQEAIYNSLKGNGLINVRKKATVINTIPNNNNNHLRSMHALFALCKQFLIKVWPMYEVFWYLPQLSERVVRQILHDFPVTNLVSDRTRTWTHLSSPCLGVCIQYYDNSLPGDTKKSPSEMPLHSSFS